MVAPQKTHSGSRFSRARAYLTTRVDPLTSVVLVLPMYLFYQLGLLLTMDCNQGQCRWVSNGVDIFTGTLFTIAGGSRLTLALMTLIGALLFGAAIWWAKRRANGGLSERNTVATHALIPVLIESTLWASIAAPLASALSHAIGLGRRGGNIFSDIVASFGAGLHEELIFRAGMFAGLLWLLSKSIKVKLLPMLLAGVISSVVFSLIHHVGPMGEPFTMRAFVFRFILGMMFAGLYKTRGFAVAAWTHALYDCWIFTLQRVLGT